MNINNINVNKYPVSQVFDPDSIIARGPASRCSSAQEKNRPEKDAV